MMFLAYEYIKFEAKNDGMGSLGLQVPLAIAKFSDLVRLLTATSWQRWATSPKHCDLEDQDHFTFST